jgi:hypothetical protein
MNEHRNPTHSRRALLLLLAAASASIGVLVAKRATEAQQTPVPHLDEKRPSGASARLYTRSDEGRCRGENPMFKAGSRCWNCVQLL